MNKKFIDFMSPFMDKKLAVAVSGGVDSVCLLCWLGEIGANITCLHVHHGLRSNADIESQYVADLCKQLGVPCHIFRWTGEKPAHGLEAAARDARYKFMTDFCRENDIDSLLIAHQSDDQIETFLMNLARGSGLSGLAAIAPITYRDGVKIVRPLLNVSRKELRDWCDANNVKYFMDEMNDDPKYTRVRIRQNRHILSEKLGISDARILLAIENLGRARDVLAENVNDLISQVMRNDYAMFSESFLFDLAPEIRLKFLGTLILRIGRDQYPPRLKSLIAAMTRLTGDTQFTLGHCTLRRHSGKILIVPEGARTSLRKRYEKEKRNNRKNQQH